MYFVISLVCRTHSCRCQYTCQFTKSSIASQPARPNFEFDFGLDVLVVPKPTRPHWPQEARHSKGFWSTASKSKASVRLPRRRRHYRCDWPARPARTVSHGSGLDTERSRQANPHCSRGEREQLSLWDIRWSGLWVFGRSLEWRQRKPKYRTTATEQQLCNWFWVPGRFSVSK